MAGRYAPHGLYHPAQLGGLSVTRFAEAVTAEGSPCAPGINKPLHTHALLITADAYGHDRPTRIAFADRDLRQPIGTLPISEKFGHHTYSIPWFKHHRRRSSSSTLTLIARWRKTIKRSLPMTPATHPISVAGISSNQNKPGGRCGSWSPAR